MWNSWSQYLYIHEYFPMQFHGQQRFHQVFYHWSQALCYIRILKSSIHKRILGTLSKTTYFSGPTCYLERNFHLKWYQNMHSIDQNIMRKNYFYFHECPSFEFGLRYSRHVFYELKCHSLKWQSVAQMKRIIGQPS